MAFVKKDIIDRTAVKLKAEKEFVGSTDRRNVGAVVEAVLVSLRELLTECSSKNDRLEIRHFGTFEIRHMKPRPSARNPRFPEKEMLVPARRKIHFRSCKMLRGVLNGAEEQS